MPTTRSSRRNHDDAPDTSAAFARLNSLDQGPEHAALRDALVAQWLPMSQRLAGKYRNRGAELDDLRQVAAMGLVKAVDRYEVARGAFESYAIPTINGELKRHFRDALWSVHVPRRVQEARNKVRIARNELRAAQPGEPTVAELAAQAGLEQGDVRDGLEALQSFKSLSLDAETASGDGDGEGASLADSLGTSEPGFDTVVDREAVKPALRALPERESKILYMRFFQDKTQNQIATELGISQMHVSRLITRTCTRIREQALAEHRDAA
ncbi:SigB/SigF/SigG family RNA polymerase sigma factor [Streptomyces violascens]|uniref:RNA polymerase sigma factor n=1 Tax=Streptomyces violascens TaxID=67381 RepID=A0ABQ3QS40_9ACTN|nr:SigB/SigF/SigG family RNA polymerase sigma factor [Streptomyces violascens]GGU51574.1 RNA polymerase sigma factor [Streptomyces violascens]GHI40107.1 RNA polymerase sigma factor [Streptomyces violascens]